MFPDCGEFSENGDSGDSHGVKTVIHAIHRFRLSRLQTHPRDEVYAQVLGS